MIYDGLYYGDLIVDANICAAVQGLKDPSYKPLTGEEDETCVLQVGRVLCLLHGGLAATMAC